MNDHLGDLPAPATAREADPATAPSPPAVDLDAVAGSLAGVESALERLDAGTYGTCESCGDPIGDEVLAEDPTAVACAAHLRL